MAGGRRSLALEVVVMALDAMRANKMRSFLTVLGVVIGVSTVIGMGALVQGLDRSMARQFRTFGSHVLWIRPFSQNGPHNGPLPDSLRLRHAFTDDDLRAIRENCPAVKLVTPIDGVDGAPSLTYGREKTRSSGVLGTTSDYFEISGLDVARGRAFTESEVSHSAQVIMLGQDILETLFPHASSVGKTVHLGGVPFVVVGEVARRGKMFGQSTDNIIVIPYTTLKKYFPSEQGPSRQNEFAMKAKPARDDLMTTAIDQITEVLRRQRHLKARQSDNFAIETDDALINLYHQLTGAIYLVMMAISSIALMVGGIGVMNIMLVSVKERTREIGVRMAMGARRGDILTQFLLEAATLTGVGGVIGILLGAVLSTLVSLATPLPSAVAPWSVAAGLALSVGTGLFFGIYPAYRASRLDPIEALRYE
ncbi:MAG TPA: ABC transporter permease [Candidatus Saccharimonadales bacterium]|nr:ABC transporter permease [Candidatus Saccharimonadales bacterium]